MVRYLSIDDLESRETSRPKRFTSLRFRTLTTAPIFSGSAGAMPSCRGRATSGPATRSRSTPCGAGHRAAPPRSQFSRAGTSRRRAVEERRGHSLRHADIIAALETNRYAAAGVDIDAKAAALARARDSIRSTFTPGVLGDVRRVRWAVPTPTFSDIPQSPLLVASEPMAWERSYTVAFQTPGAVVVLLRRADLVNHCVNDILVQGARAPCFSSTTSQWAWKPYLALAS